METTIDAYLVVVEDKGRDVGKEQDGQHVGRHQPFGAPLDKPLDDDGRGEQTD